MNLNESQKPNKVSITKRIVFAILPGLIVAGLIFSANTYYDLDLGKVIVEEITKIVGQLETTATTTLATISGQVGVGTEEPISLLEVYSNTTESRLTITAATSTDSILAFRTGSSPSTQALIGIDQSDSNKLKLVRGSDIATSTGITIDASGNVGIGTTTPTAKLTVTQSGTGEIVEFKDSTTTVFAIQDGGNVVVSEINNTIYVDGTKYPADGAGIQKAINDLGPSGGKVILPQGTYNIGATSTIDTCDSAWTASANVTSTTDTSDKKEGTASVKFEIDDAFTTGTIAYHTISSIDISE